MFAIQADNMCHTPPFQVAAGRELAHKEALRAGKAEAFLGMDVLLDDDFFERVKFEWQEAMKEAGRL